MDDAALQLPNDPAILKRIIAQRDGVIAQERAAHAAALAQRQTLLDQCQEALQTLREDHALLQHRLNLLLRASYGPRAERFDPRQLLLFGLLVPPLEPLDLSSPPSDATSAHAPDAAVGKKRKAHGRRPLAAQLPRIPIERGLAGPGLLAHVITSKLADHLPLYCIQQTFARCF